jgi:antitoxin component YwqK of YwqJK toxin-antitoxin module
MKSTLLTSFYICCALFSICSVSSCKISWLKREPTVVQSQFPISALDASTNAIHVGNYDTVSYFESPYQNFMLNSKDKPDGKFIVYDEKDRIRRTLTYKNHLREGIDTWFYEDGQVMQEKRFVHDKYVSYKTYYPNHHLLETEVNDTLGFKKHWDEQGILVSEKNYVTGYYKEWYANGKPSSEGLECPGECFTLLGPWKYYDQSGHLLQIVFYRGLTDYNAWDSIYHYQGNKIVSIERN